MDWRKLLWVVALAGSVQGASADAVDDAILAQLEAQGFTEIHVETSWLGRRVIEAFRADGRREIVLNPRTGEILRDTWIGLSGRAAILDPTGKASSERNLAQGSGAERPKTVETAASAASSTSGSSTSGSTSGSGSSGSNASGRSNSGSSGSGTSGAEDDSSKSESEKPESEKPESGKGSDNSGGDDDQDEDD